MLLEKDVCKTGWISAQILGNEMMMDWNLWYCYVPTICALFRLVCNPAKALYILC